MSTELYQKVTPGHLRRDAFLYVRQSSLRQVFENTESTKRQYALRERAVSPGWPIERVHVIDSDLGLSGASAEHRDGFQQLVSEVAIGHAGIVLGLEVSRLARNNADWHRLIELAALTHTKVSGRLEPYYVCHDVAAHDAGKPCQLVRGRAIDDAISALLLQTVGPAAIEVALAVEDEIAGRIEQANSMRLKQLERARYEAELARRRYMNVDPANRMVADALEADWNDRLRRLDVLQQDHERQRRSDQDLLGDQARARIRDLADDFVVVWNDRRIESVERKRMLRLLIEDATLVKSEKVSIHVRFRGGRTTSLTVDKPRSMALVRKTQPAVVTVIDGLLETCTDQQVATRLNELGYTNWQHQTFTARKVALVRTAYGLPSRFERLRSRGLLTGAELATQLKVSQTTIHQWGRQGLLRRHVYGHDHRCLYEPLGNVVLVRGIGGRKATRPIFIAAPTPGQGAM
ncbi:hypothetical protein P3T43_006430 [Paraburkholderia sp. GAS41]|uniref:recombinase family protein n=1 Tax=Paraburkholderia sp. GAS41 TaxID=3035134 RepID=UPI003D1EDD81